MNLTLDIARFALFGALVIGMGRPFGIYLAGVYAGERTWLSPVFGPLERLFYRVVGVDHTTEMPWVSYAVALLLFNFACFVILYALLRLSGADPGAEIIGFARTHQVTFIVMGQSARSRLDEVVRGSIVNRIMRETRNIDIVVVSDLEREARTDASAGDG